MATVLKMAWLFATRFLAPRDLQRKHGVNPWGPPVTDMTKDGTGRS
jgi:hypothetical protein